jgi:hypothetical protein
LLYSSGAIVDKGFLVVDSDMALELGVLCMEVRRWMILEVHVDRDAEELRDLGHSGAPVDTPRHPRRI